MDHLDNMRAFVRVAERGSFTQASRELGLPKASVSSAIRELEDSLGTRLLHRTTRKVQLTVDGGIYLQRCKGLLADMEELASMFQVTAGEMRGRLRVDMPIATATSLVLPRLSELLSAHPKLQVELNSTDRLVDVVKEGYDCVLRVGTLPDSNLVGRKLGHFRMVNCASPGYLNLRGVPLSPHELTHHWLIRYEVESGLRDEGFEYADERGVHVVPMDGPLTVNNTVTYQAACLAGLGLIQAPEVGVRGLLDAGLLVEVLPQYRPKAMPVHLLYPNKQNLPKRVHAFMNWLADVLAPSLE